MSENTALKMKCHQLQSRLEALVATAGTDPSWQAQAAEKLEQKETEREKLEEEKQQLAGQVNEWEEKYRAENNGSNPSEEERTEALTEIESKMESIDSQLKSVSNTVVALSMMRDGDVGDDVGVGLEAPSGGEVDLREVDELRARVVELEEENDRLMEELDQLRRQRSRMRSVGSKMEGDEEGEDEEEEKEDEEEEELLEESGKWLIDIQ